MKHVRKRILSLLLSVLIIFSCVISCVLPVFAADDKAATMQMTKTEGTVGVSTDNGKEVSVIKKMRLYSGYQLETAEKSYAWISLDSSKLIKMDAVSKASIRKRGKELEILSNAGNIFFNVEKPLESDESLNIRTSTMVVGIRGTCGWMEVVSAEEVLVSVLEGDTQIVVQDPVSGQRKTDVLSGGETAVCKINAPTSSSAPPPW